MAFISDERAARKAEESPASHDRLAQPQADASPQAIRFSLRELLIAVTVVAVLLGLLRFAGIFGAVVAFLVTAIFTWIGYPQWKPNDLRSQQAMFDFLWGVGMPLVCLVFDPFVFKESAGFRPQTLMETKPTLDEVRDSGFFAYAFVAGQIVVMTTWLVLGRLAGRWMPFFGGYLASGLVFATLVGVILAIPAVFGVFFFGVGLLGLTPLITAFSYWRQCRRALAATQPELVPLAVFGTGAERVPLAVLGFFTSIAGSVFLGAALLAAVRGPDAVRTLMGD